MKQLYKATEMLAGRGLHSGRLARLRIVPAAREAGICFVRRDLDPWAVVPADLGHVVRAARQTLLGRDGVVVATVEHVLAALAGLGIYDAEVQLWGGEVPALDGSAAPFVRALLPACRECGVRPRRGWLVQRYFARRRGATVCQLIPELGKPMIECEVYFAGAAIGGQHARLALGGAEAFARRVARARTFGFVAEQTVLRSQGLARGAGLGNTLIYTSAGPLNPEGQRFRDEPVRHKLLDALGDLALLGGPLQGKLRLQRCSHALLQQTLQDALAAGALVAAQLT